MNLQNVAKVKNIYEYIIIMKNKYINKFLISISCCAFIIIACFSLNFYVTKKNKISNFSQIKDPEIKVQTKGKVNMVFNIEIRNKDKKRISI